MNPPSVLGKRVHVSRGVHKGKTDTIVLSNPYNHKVEFDDGSIGSVGINYCEVLLSAVARMPSPPPPHYVPRRSVNRNPYVVALPERLHADQVGDSLVVAEVLEVIDDEHAGRRFNEEMDRLDYLALQREAESTRLYALALQHKAQTTRSNNMRAIELAERRAAIRWDAYDARDCYDSDTSYSSSEEISDEDDC
jgi:hypothetical protein